MEHFSNIVSLYRRRHRRMRIVLVFTLLAYGIDMISYSWSHHVSPSRTALDPPFATGCLTRDQDLPADLAHGSHSDGGRTPSNGTENATIMILARNSDLAGVIKSVKSLEEQWNKQYHYPYVFLNDKEWDPEFETFMREITDSELTFDTIPTEMWSWPKNADGTDAVDRKLATKNWERMRAAGLPYVDRESYHHMCRFFSGFFYDHPAMSKYRYFWRVEPDVDFTCRIPYDPFLFMRLHKKIYGYTMALWEIGSTCPSLFRTTADFKQNEALPTSSLWTSMLSWNWAPLPIRWLVLSMPSLFHSRDAYGDGWNHCHFWSNFEIADMEFFRSPQYRSYFATLDKAGGFFTERWGDAPVHSLALALFAEVDRLHYFEDIGYRHAPFQNCPPEGVGCDCACDGQQGHVDGFCLDRLTRSVRT